MFTLRMIARNLTSKFRHRKLLRNYMNTIMGNRSQVMIWEHKSNKFVSKMWHRKTQDPSRVLWMCLNKWPLPSVNKCKLTTWRTRWWATTWCKMWWATLSIRDRFLQTWWISTAKCWCSKRSSPRIHLPLQTNSLKLTSISQWMRSHSKCLTNLCMKTTQIWWHWVKVAIQLILRILVTA